jgi:hypothetical protein
MKKQLRAWGFLLNMFSITPIRGDHGNGFSNSWNFDLFTISKESWRE